MHLGFLRFIFALSAKLKPFLIRIIPIEILRSVKRQLISYSFKSVQPFLPNQFPYGINLIGFIRGEIGLGQSCRLIADTLKASDFEFTIYNFDQLKNMRYNDHSWDHKITDACPNNVNLIHINPPELTYAFVQLGQHSFDYRYNIAFWLWELEEFPEEWISSLKLVNEIWTPSEFTSKSICKKTNLPVVTIPYAINVPVDRQFDRDFFHLPENLFLFLVMYDCNSTIERKNPLGAITAYKRAFCKDNHTVGLVIKMNNPKQKDLNLIQKTLAGYNNIFIIPEILEKIQVNSLISCIDVFVSLHRSEGFGLVLAEAMLLGIPTIATNWSSNTEFMSSETACLVDFDFLTIEKDFGPYKAGNRWADPKIDQAANYMQKLYEDKAFYQTISMNSKKYITENLNVENASQLINKRLNEIYELCK